MLLNVIFKELSRCAMCSEFIVTTLSFYNNVCTIQTASIVHLQPVRMNFVSIPSNLLNFIYIYSYKMAENFFIVDVYVIRVRTENIIGVFGNLFTEHLYFFVGYMLCL